MVKQITLRDIDKLFTKRFKEQDKKFEKLLSYFYDKVDPILNEVKTNPPK